MNYCQSSKIDIDKSFPRNYNGIVNSKGAADMELVYSANSIHKGVYDVLRLSVRRTPF